MKRSIRLGLLLVFVLMVCSIGQALAAGLTQEQIDAMDSYVQEYMDKYQVPGMSLVIVSEGQAVLTKGYGTSDVNREIPVDADTNFQIASVSKNFTALAILQLRDRGLLNMDDPVIKYLPWFASKDSERSNKITIAHLVHHTSGIPTQAYGLEIEGATEEQLTEQVKRLKEITLTAEPGVRHQYSNLNYWALALLIETVTGMPFSEYMEQNVFAPLNMDRTGYINKVAEMENVSIGYRMENGKHTPFDYYVPSVINAAGGLFTNADDMANYMIALLNNGYYNGIEVLQADSAYEMMHEGFDLGARNGYARFYCYGLYNIDTEWGNTVQHGGDNPNFTSELFLFPELNVGYALFSNSQHTITHSIAPNLTSIVFGNPTKPINITSTEAGMGLVSILRLAKYPIVLIIAIWLMIVLLGLKKGKYTFGKPGVVRIILHVILFPLVLLYAAFFLYQLPIAMIGSLRIAMLYQPDQVTAVLVLTVTLVLFALFMAVMGFVKKTKTVKIDEMTKTT